MKLIAIPTRDSMVLCRAKRQSRADDHFGHCAYYTVVTLDEQNQVVKQERLDSPEGCGCKSNIASVGAFVNFYVDKTSGTTRMEEYVPNLDVRSEAGTIELFDYLEQKK